MKNRFASLIPPNADNVLELISEDVDELSSIKDSYLLINPNCNYQLSNNFNLKKNFFDVIFVSSSTFGNLHSQKLIDFINKVADYVKADGQIIFLLENIAFGENLVAILNGKIKFNVSLTFEEFNSAINQSKLKSTKAMNTLSDVAVPRALAEISKVPLNADHFVIFAVKKSIDIKRTLIQSYLGEVLVCANIRVNEPNRFISSIPGVITHSSRAGETLSISRENFDKKIFINQRVSADEFEKGIYLFESLVNRNYLFIEEIDDNPVLWRKKYEETNFINFIGVHGIQTSTDSLAELFKRFNPNVKVFKNQLTELPEPRDFAEELKSNQPTVIFFGALNRDKDFYEILPAINKIAAEYGDKILFKVIAKTELFNTIKTEHKIFIGKREVYNGQYVPYNVYSNELHSSHISILPLRNNIFNRSKSDLKFIESAGNGSVVIASPTVYSDSVVDGQTGFIYHDVNEFYNTLKLLIDNPTKRIDVAKNAYEYVKHNRLLSQHFEERWDWYNELLAKLPQLNKETHQRIEILKSKGYHAFGGFDEINEHIDVFDN